MLLQIDKFWIPRKAPPDQGPNDVEHLFSIVATKYIQSESDLIRRIQSGRGKRSLSRRHGSKGSSLEDMCVQLYMIRCAERGVEINAGALSDEGDDDVIEPAVTEGPHGPNGVGHGTGDGVIGTTVEPATQPILSGSAFVSPSSVLHYTPSPLTIAPGPDDDEEILVDEVDKDVDYEDDVQPSNKRRAPDDEDDMHGQAQDIRVRGRPPQASDEASSSRQSAGGGRSVQRQLYQSDVASTSHSSTRAAGTDSLAFTRCTISLTYLSFHLVAVSRRDPSPGPKRTRRNRHDDDAVPPVDVVP